MPKTPPRSPSPAEAYPDDDASLGIELALAGHVLPEPRKYRELVLDLEGTGGFSGSPNQTITVACFKAPGHRGEQFVFRIDDFKQRLGPWDDRPLLGAIRGMLAQTARVITFYGRNFDVPAIRGRSMLLGLHHEPVTFRHIDIYPHVKRGFRWGRCDLETLGLTFFNEYKPKPHPEVWRRAGFGDREALDIVTERCIGDVKITEHAYLLFEAYITTQHQETV